MLNFLLAPLHTRVFLDQADYGIISEMYAYVTFLNVIFMYGMETAFFVLLPVRIRMITEKCSAQRRVH